MDFALVRAKNLVSGIRPLSQRRRLHCAGFGAWLHHSPVVWSRFPQTLRFFRGKRRWITSTWQLLYLLSITFSEHLVQCPALVFDKQKKRYKDFLLPGSGVWLLQSSVDPKKWFKEVSNHLFNNKSSMSVYLWEGCLPGVWVKTVLRQWLTKASG